MRGRVQGGEEHQMARTRNDTTLAVRLVDRCLTVRKCKDVRRSLNNIYSFRLALWGESEAMRGSGSLAS